MKSNLTASDLKWMYGTAWKEAKTEKLTSMALAAGFRAIDTANQRKHYYEEGVGNALQGAFNSNLTREDIFIQTKFTSVSGQDHRLPYDKNEGAKTQVLQSFESSLNHLQVDYIDSYIYHGPSVVEGLADHDFMVWQAMESLVKEGRISYIGVSNVSLSQLQILCQHCKIKPSFVQNRCFASQAWDKGIRQFCKQRHIIYQGFSLLTANTFIKPKIEEIAKKYEKSEAQIVFQFASQIGMLPLTGTSSMQHMAEDLTLNFKLTQDELNTIEYIYFK